MKKQLLLIFIIFAVFSFLGSPQVQAASSITVTSPAGGESWAQGSAHNITWAYQEVTAPVNIYLYKGGGHNRDIALNEPCDGAYAWTIPASLPVGSDYQVVIQGTGAAFFTSDRSGNFSITGTAAPTGVPHLNSLSPTSGPSDTLITISGTNFNPDPSSNFIWMEGWHYPNEASASQLKFHAPYLSNGSYSVYVESMTQSGRTRSDNSKTFTITTSCPYSSTGDCECIPTTLAEGGCVSPGKCSPDCTGSFAGKVCYSDIDCTQAGQCNSPNKCSSPAQPCSSVGSGWSGVGGSCANGGTCCAPPSGSSKAPGSSGTSQEGALQNPLGYDTFEDLVNAIIGFLIKIGIPLATIMFVIAGVLFVTSAGDPNRVSTAKKFMLYTAIGLAVILVSSGLIKVLQSLLQSS